MSLDLDTVLVSAALVASSINTLISTFMLFTQLNEKVKLLHALQSLSRAMVFVAKKTPFKKKPGNGAIATAGTVRRRK